MWNEPTPEELGRLPKLYSTENAPWREKIIYEHFFIFGSDWYAAEYGHEEQLFFGYAILNDDLDNAEWGYFSLREMRPIQVHGIEIDRDLHWKPRRASKVERIVEAHRKQRRS